MLKFRTVKMRIPTIKEREDRMRRRFRQQGCLIRKARKKVDKEHYGGYMLVEAYDDEIIVAGEDYSLSLEDLEKFIGDDMKIIRCY